MLQSFFGSRVASRIPEVDAYELQDLIQHDNNLLLVDVRSPHEYEHDGRIAGSRLLPLPALMQRMKELPEDQPIVFICRSGNRSMVACEQMSRLGYDNVKNFRGGMISWKRSGMPTR
ncbi:MAG: rhodanese-like domain-containing protein [Chloroflexi bacterium]|jgi:rhodanese-related sulfurtransferase|nr:rhodanese-like domain-containing protein [Chloroflexota bacterium]